MRTICAVVLVLESVAIGLAIPVAIMQGGVAPGVAGLVWGGMAVAAVLLAGLQRKHGWAHAGGWVLQAAFLVSSFAVPMLWIVAAIFAGLWVTGFMLGRSTDAIERQRAEAVPAAE
ncbi:uncharacterized protein DUF4233 [Murinocardiopsis flavida]|uniref:Uncharacterized protein DUF4233 n=1 Tax=Murinocardiopsis flavida TaxID=645275 RepID=A0A2P8DUA3_9ACTN|nr:DUF4233 domain-containing protein [Murinocardiopsis flavida]PSL00785.1 uncharacterized protein DUF4233 [Murinocardiopsis flavida]